MATESPSQQDPNPPAQERVDTAMDTDEPAAPAPIENTQIEPDSTAQEGGRGEGGGEAHSQQQPQESLLQPSPPPPPPQQQQPVIPGPRATRFQQLYAHSLQRTLGKLKWDNFAACYPTIAKKAEPVLRQVQGQMVDKLGEKCEKEFENIMVTRQVVPKINELENLISDASHRRASSADGPEPTPPHLLPAEAILAAHLTPTLTSHQSHLNARLQTAQSHNAILYDEIHRQRAEIDSLMQALESAVGDIRGANAALAPVVQQIAAEARQADVNVTERR
ncbi:hypothetical protein PT974_08253 [Cladobotryum mycophilum]|uniref:Kinetochore-associated protein NNF1 n=1 Tax=Cladobotryum mycophilum TaxID=491253 RepID=A0ABR0SE00_9HYPO